MIIIENSLVLEAGVDVAFINSEILTKLYMGSCSRGCLLSAHPAVAAAAAASNEPTRH